MAVHVKRREQMNKVFIIAEAGVNHNGDLGLAKALIDVAYEAGVDAIKFQSFKAEKLVAKHAKKAAYQQETTGNEESQFEMLKKLELDIEAHQMLMDYAKEKELMFLSTPFDLESIELLEELGLPLYKIASGELTNLPYLKRIAQKHKPVIVSTGMATLEEVEACLAVLRTNGASDITVLHCNTEYPTPVIDVNLRAMDTLREKLGVRVGYSDHTLGIEMPIAAVAMGAVVIEKHITLDKNMEGPDHRASLEPQELKQMVQAIRNVECAMGTGLKVPSASELKNKEVARKSIVAATVIKKGELLTEENLTVKRPGTGLSPMLWDEVIGTYATKDFEEDELITR